MLAQACATIVLELLSGNKLFYNKMPAISSMSFSSGHIN